MLMIKTDNYGTYWIELAGECIHGGLTKQNCLSLPRKLPENLGCWVYGC